MDYSFLLLGDYGKEKTTADKWQTGERAKLAARRTKTFVGQSSPGPAKKQLLCVLRVSVVNIFLKLHQPMSNQLLPL